MEQLAEISALIWCAAAFRAGNSGNLPRLANPWAN
jgi:hypothetical protein